MSVSAIHASTALSQMNVLNANKNTVKAKAQAASGSSSSSSSSSSSGLGGTSAGTTFLNLLVQELQNQDPSSPVDSTAMVGQMISLNQLDQLISINQTLTTASSSSSSSGSSSGSGSSSSGGSASGQTASVNGNLSSSDLMEKRAELQHSAQNVNAVQTATQAASDPTRTLDLSTLNIPNGGK